MRVSPCVNRVERQTRSRRGAGGSRRITLCCAAVRPRTSGSAQSRAVDTGVAHTRRTQRAAAGRNTQPLWQQTSPATRYSCVRATSNERKRPNVGSGYVLVGLPGWLAFAYGRSYY